MLAAAAVSACRWAAPRSGALCRRSVGVSAVRPLSLFGFKSPAAEPVDIEERTKGLHLDVLGPLNDKLRGPLDKHSDQLTPLPMVFVLGNHSSGKSTFINHVLNREVQKTGVAPTDDAFTVIVPGHEDADQDGPAFVGDPDLGFNGLRRFGTALINHVALKVRTDLDIPNIMVVDSPGMIDSPVSADSGSSGSQGSLSLGTTRDRGYDFPTVVRWFAERADVILLFFDPDKPGTTGETLACMTHSLSGLDSKVFIVLNKVDQFQKLHDFARAYGSLCWNLSKVIPRKDLPPIYTTCLPVEQSKPSPVLEQAMADFIAARHEIVDQVKNAPLRRIDNVITGLDDSTRVLRMYAAVLEAARKDYHTTRRRWLFASSGCFLSGASLAWLALLSGMWEVAVPVAALALVATGGVWWNARSVLSNLAEQYTNGSKIDDAFRSVHYLQLADNNDYVLALWERVRPQLKRSLATIGFDNLPAVRSSELSRLDAMLKDEVPEFRRQNTKATSFLASKQATDRAQKALDRLSQNSQPRSAHTE